MLIFFVVVVSLFAGIALCGLGVFLFFLYNAIKRLGEVAESVHALIQPMSSGNLLPDMLKSFQSASKTGKQITDGLAAITQVVGRLNQLMYQNLYGAREATAANAPVPGQLNINDQESWFKAPTEEEQAHVEAVEEAKAAGIPTNEEEMPNGEPPLSGMVGGEA